MSICNPNKSHRRLKDFLYIGYLYKIRIFILLFYFYFPEVSSIHSSQAHFGLKDPDEYIPQLVSYLCDEDQVSWIVLLQLCNVYYRPKYLQTLYAIESNFLKSP